MLSYNESIVLEVDELTLLILRVWHTCRKDGDTRICPYSVEGVIIERYHPLECMVLEDITLDGLLCCSLTGNGRLRYNDDCPGVLA